MSRFLGDRLKAIEAYVPGEQPRDRKYIKLNTNESPYGPPDNVVEAINSQEIYDLRLYGDPECRELKDALSRIYGIDRSKIFVSNGSDEVLNFSFMAYGHKGASFADITYGFYSVFAELYGIDTDIIPLKEDFSIDPSDYYGKNNLVVIANPNAPSGLFMPLSSVEEIVKSNPEGLVLIDEAYVDFGGESALSLVDDYENLLVVRTFSKSRSMAGARLGFAFGNAALISDLEKIKYSTNPYNVNRLTQRAGIAALENDKYFMDNCQRIINTRELVIKRLKALGFEATDSRTNFVFVTSERIEGSVYYKMLRERGILVRYFPGERTGAYNRITIGSEEEMNTFIRITEEIMEEVSA